LTKSSIWDSMGIPPGSGNDGLVSPFYSREVGTLPKNQTSRNESVMAG